MTSRIAVVSIAVTLAGCSALYENHIRFAQSAPAYSRLLDARAVSFGSRLSMVPVTEGKLSYCNLDEDILFSCMSRRRPLAVCAKKQSDGTSRVRFLMGPNTQRALADMPDPVFVWRKLAYSGGGGTEIVMKSALYEVSAYSLVVRTGFDGKGNDPQVIAGIQKKRGSQSIFNYKCDNPDSVSEYSPGVANHLSRELDPPLLLEH